MGDNKEKINSPDQTINIFDPETNVTEELRIQISLLATELAKINEETESKITEDITNAFIDGVVKNLEEAKEMVLNGPLVRGFNETRDPKIPNEIVKEFLVETFGKNISQKFLLGLVSKDDKFLMYRGSDSKKFALFGELGDKGLLKPVPGLFSVRYADTIEDYTKAALIMEGQTDPNKLQHIYKVRATAGSPKMMSKIQLRNFGIEKVSDYDYLNDLSLPDEDKMRAYILGTLAHEVAHRIEKTMEPKLLNDFQKIIEDEAHPTRGNYVSEYTKRHSEIYKSDLATITKEDFVESIRIYTTNPEFLKRNFPKRFNFILENLSFIKAGVVIEAIKKMGK